MSRSNEYDDMPKKELDFLKPALAGGAFMSILTSLCSLVSTKAKLPALQITCCLWLVGGGALAAYLLNKQRPGGLTYGDGALAGLFSGIFAAILGAVLGIPVRMLIAPELQEAADQFQQQSAQMPPAMRDFVLQQLAPGISLTGLLIGLVFGLVLYSIFMTAAGALTVAILNRKKTD